MGGGVDRDNGKVNFAGEGLAVVVARDPASAKDATEAVVVDYDELDPVLDMEAAVAEGEPARLTRDGDVIAVARRRGEELRPEVVLG